MKEIAEKLEELGWRLQKEAEALWSEAATCWGLADRIKTGKVEDANDLEMVSVEISHRECLRVTKDRHADA